MQFLDPKTMLIAAGLTIPPLIALYFLKLKRVVRTVPSTLLWKRAVEDLHVNAPFQRLRASLLLLLQLLVLVLAALALGKPMFQSVQKFEDTVIVMVDQSASMGVVEQDGRTRLEHAKEQAKKHIENLAPDARAMVIAFADRATVVASFDTDRRAVQRKIDSIEQTQSTSALGEAMSLAEAYTQNVMLGDEDGNAQQPPELSVQPASVFLFTDGNIDDAGAVALQHFELSKIQVVRVGSRSDNIGITAMDARRNYDQPEMLEASATIQNFGDHTVAADVVLYVDGRTVDVQTVQLQPAGDSVERTATEAPGAAPEESGDTAVAAFDNIEFGGGGVVEVMLRVDDALPADDRAWTVVDEPRSVRVLLVGQDNWLLESALAALPLKLTTMTPEAYEAAPDDQLMEGKRSAFDLVILDRHSTARLPQGSYFFWAAAPQIPGVAAGDFVADEVIVNWDETHPILRHVAVETLSLMQWRRLALPPEATSIIEGESGPVLSYFTRDGSLFLISAFSLVAEDDSGGLRFNTDWSASVDYVLFMHNAVQYLGSGGATRGRRSLKPGEAVTLAVPAGGDAAHVVRPDGVVDAVPAAGSAVVYYSNTRRVGPYRLEAEGAAGQYFAVNLFDPVESAVKPADKLTLGTEQVATQAAQVEVNQPAWRYVLLGLLFFVLLEWFIYNRRVFV